jgi:DNA-directed RNA polymerase subunit RPC12/RpoP
MATIIDLHEALPSHLIQKASDMTTEEEKTYECTKCGATFYSREALRKHIYEEHIEDEDKHSRLDLE